MTVDRATHNYIVNTHKPWLFVCVLHVHDGGRASPSITLGSTEQIEISSDLKVEEGYFGAILSEVSPRHD